ncbi:MAG TPA: TIGR02300 family protein [Solirubrobacterales bacterium]|nr:TIGR02300 family protein [Solirubrobacterales bacterium]
MAREPALFSPLHEEAPALANPELGAKQICPTCSSKFYDLGRRPAHCPKCGAEFDPEEALRNRRVRPRGPLPEEEQEEVRAKPVESDEEELEAAEEAPELDEAVEAEPLDTGDDEDDDGDGKVTAPDEAAGVDFTEEEDLEDSDDDEVPFIEDEDDEFSEDEIDGLPEEGQSDE